MESVQISNVAVQNILFSLNEQNSPGPVGLHPNILKILAPFIVEPLAHLFNLFLASEQVTNDWRMATMCPILKKDSRAIPENNRPVSVTSIVCKTLESIPSIMCDD